MSVRLRDRVEVLNAPKMVEDERGNTSADWSKATGLVEPARVEPVSSTEQTTGQQLVTSRWVCSLLTVTTATSTSKLRWRGQLYEIDSEMLLGVTGRGQGHHYNCELKRFAG